ncbi:unnamed protein product [Ciceribacter selenitireducens ATCC BAA-1503]|uniref:Uncharacterized protein n=1 Tax=Ciceribacter selenitireducens ATCC BAA-1503 TaxID=1336235 RepID=A0A376AJV7_9HYPH|nr:unnamed protein product [Ciceribacter selenitireducens ATCC BAA-1503]
MVSPPPSRSGYTGRKSSGRARRLCRAAQKHDSRQINSRQIPATGTPGCLHTRPLLPVLPRPQRSGRPKVIA